ncbi:unnamed protein product [Ixodes persulcatus]
MLPLSVASLDTRSRCFPYLAIGKKQAYAFHAHL